MTVRLEKAFFETREQVLEDILKNGTWPTTFVSGPSEGLPLHWHREEVHGYVMEGETDFLDGETETRTKVGPGDKIIIPARTLHAEGTVKDRVVYIIALPAPLGPDQFLAMQPPDDLQPDA